MNPADIQGIVARGYRRLRYARYILLRFRDDPDNVRRWLYNFVPCIDNALPKENGPVASPNVRVNLAFTFQGLEKLGLPEDALNTFPLEFAEGLGVPWTSGNEPDHRSRILGDTGESRPDKWDWGYQAEDRVVHALLLAFAHDEGELENTVSSWIAAAEKSGAIAIGTTRVLAGGFSKDPHSRNEEPFGFADGISQPVLKSASARLAGAGESRQPRAHEVEDGEVLLGYRDGAGMMPASPSVAAEADPGHVLPVAAALNGANRHDVGHNGTFLVFRQLSQDVAAFNEACACAAASTGLDADYVGAMIVGRWKDGSPLISTPIAPDPRLAQLPAANDFIYGSDPDGKRCPIGAHIRRANPRDGLGFDSATSLEIANRHRILRRGRRYEIDGDVGLHFICLNASIARQFEFVQQNWINDSTFGGLTGEDDPLVGAHLHAGATTDFTIPPAPESLMARHVVPLKRFVTVKGGGYFFLPSLSALHYVSSDPSQLAVTHRSLAWQARPVTPTFSDTVRLLALARVPLLSAFVLLGVPFASLAPAQVSAILGPTFDLDHWWEMFAVSTLTSLAAVGSLLTFRMLQLYAWPRFQVRTTIKPITWRSVILQQLISLPIVVWAWFNSSRDAMTTVDSFKVSSYAQFGAAAIAGYLLAFLFIRFAAAAHAVYARSRRFAPVLLPAALIETRMERLAARSLRGLHRIVDLIERQAAQLSPDTAAGYVDPQGRLLPGHLTLLAFLSVLAMLYAAGWFLLRPIGWCFVPPPGVLQIPPLGYLAFTVLVLGLAGSSATFLLDKYRVPLVSILLGWFAFASITAGTDHQFETRPELLRSPADMAAVIKPTGQMDPIIVVAAAGGGIRQTVWTTQVLTGLTTLWPEFPKRLTLVSAVSGGSLGALYYLNGYDRFYTHPADSPVLQPPDFHPVVHASATSGSGDIWWGLTYPDSARAIVAFFPTLLFPRTWDRGWALERAWANALGYSKNDEPTLNTWRHKTTDGWLPAIAFNATVVETGARAIFTTYDPSSGAEPSARDANSWTCGHDLSVVTAARLSAAFPYVTPTARAQERPGPSVSSDRSAKAGQADPSRDCVDGRQGHLADGGYWDNFGVVTALDWLRAAQPALANRRVLLLQIEPHAEPEPTIHDRSWVWQATTPLATLLSVRTNAQRARNEDDIQALKDRWNAGKQEGDPGSLSTARMVDTGERPTLGWHLSRSERCGVEEAWRRDYVGTSRFPDPRKAMQSLDQLFGKHSADPGEPDLDCGR